MRPSNSLFKQGLKLIFIPLVLQILFVGWFATLYLDAVKAMDDRAARLYVSTACSKVGMVSMKIFAELFLVINIGKVKKSDRISMGVGIISMDKETEFRNAIAELVEAGKNKKGIEKRTLAVKKTIDDFKSVFINEYLDKKGPLPEDTVRLIVERMMPIRRLLHKTIEELNDLESTQSLNYFTSEKAELIVTGLVLIGIIANLAVSTGLWIIIRKKVLSNLDIIEENFHRLAENKELLPPIDNNDEFSEFDKNFREIEEEVVLSRLERQKYLDVMSETLRKPLIDLNMFLNDLKTENRIELTSRSEAAISRTSFTTKRLVMMLNDLIDFEQIERGIFSINVQPVAAKEVVQAAIDCTALPQDKNISIKYNISEDIMFNADPDRLTQVLTNLLSNAVKFSPDDSEILISLLTDSESFIFSVEDQGRGIPEEMLDKIFQQYEQVDQVSDSKTHKGTGLGLSICKSLIEAHGGVIWAENGKDGGAKISFSIPTNL